MVDLGMDKWKYVVNYGIVSHFTDLLKEQVCLSEWFVVCYDESLTH